jgi:hypothetical protein
VQITGHPLMNLWVTSTAKDEDFFAVLEDVAPDGKSTYVTDGKIRASRRKLGKAPWGDTDIPFHPQLEGQDEPLAADTPSELVFDFLPTSYVFKSGHRIRVAIVNSGGPAFQAPPDRDETHSPTIGVWRGTDYPSSITLPVVPAQSSLYGGHLSIDTSKVRYSGPAFLYTSPSGTYLNYGETWVRFGAARKVTGDRYAAKGDAGTITVSLHKDAGRNSATAIGAGMRFTGTGRDAAD